MVMEELGEECVVSGFLLYYLYICRIFSCVPVTLRKITTGKWKLKVDLRAWELKYKVRTATVLSVTVAILYLCKFYLLFLEAYYYLQCGPSLSVSDMAYPILNIILEKANLMLLIEICNDAQEMDREELKNF
ncbi:unnamed protein product [Leptidea sinapis]|uniref:Uncharacterized protein n=1 Tax=Leptidea sinapis TaxID=189913 RepID=A0A5E4Q2Y6_9NEOP|nr:unnamed protein product [Leptidea sinapis]